jgi:glycosyltransferase involved in cell wall biosynthesis
VLDAERSTRNRFGYFGQLTPYKGVQVALEAMRHLSTHRVHDDPLLRALESAAGRPGTPEGDGEIALPELRVHGANLDLQPGQFQNQVRALLEELRDAVHFVGRYDHAQMAGLMANVDWVIVPSIWWENSPLVIQEAFHFGRPVICSDIGGMAEKVEHGVNGLHFRAGDPVSLARTMRTALESPGLWDELRAGIAPVYRMADHVAALTTAYRSLLVREVVAHAV